MPKRAVAAAAAAFLMLAPAAAALAQEGGRPAAGAPQRQEPARPRGDEALRLPPPATISQSLEIPGRKMDYKVTAGAIVLRNDAGEPQTEIGYVAYTLEGGAAGDRPVTFAFNGGPGAASAYLHFGALGPKRLSFGNAGEGPSAPPALVDNPETWLDFTDLVFIDPVGTGYSRFVSDSRELRNSVWSVDGDINALAAVVRRYLTDNNRWQSRKFLVGESYGGFRVPKLASRLQNTEGVGVSGIVMISPVLDFTTQSDSDGSPLSFATRLPSLAALALQKKGEPLSRAALGEVEEYARGQFVVDFLRGPGDRDAVARIVDRVAGFTGLDRAFIANQAGRLDIAQVARELGRDTQSVASIYDAAVLGLDPLPFALAFRPRDPVLNASLAPLTSAAADFIGRTIGWRVDAPYRLLNDEVNRGWNWGANRDNVPEAVNDLRNALALDPALRALVVHGATDLVTPYFDSQLIIDRLTPLGAEGANAPRVRLEVLRGGHMFYSDDASRAALTDAARRLYAAQ
ncbi:S10 family peptidase [Pseudochelatococcus sp. B33]